MNFCSKCGDKLASQTAFCPSCGYSLEKKESVISELSRKVNIPDSVSDKINIADLRSKPRDFLVMSVGTGILILVSLFNWAVIPLRDLMGGMFGMSAISMNDIGLNLFRLRGQLNNFADLVGGFGGDGSEFDVYLNFMTVVMLVLLLSFALLIISCVKYKTNPRSKLMYVGFGINALAPLLFIIAVWAINSWVSSESFGMISSVINLTVFPFLAIAVSVGAIIYIVKRPAVEVEVS